MRSLACLFADGVLADIILIFSRTPIPPTSIRKISGSPKTCTETCNRKTIY